MMRARRAPVDCALVSTSDTNVQFRRSDRRRIDTDRRLTTSAHAQDSTNDHVIAART